MVIDSWGICVIFECILVRVIQDEISFCLWINVINDDVQVEDGNFVISMLFFVGEEGKVIEWYYVCECFEEEWVLFKLCYIKY